MKLTRALISVTDTTGLDTFAFLLHSNGVQIFADGAITQGALEAYGVPFADIQAITDYPYTLDGMIGVFHPKIAGGVMADRSDSSHMNSLRNKHIALIDLIVVNMAGRDLRNHYDAGRIALIAMAGYRGNSVAVIADRSEYLKVGSEIIQTGGQLSQETCQRLTENAQYRASEWFGMNARRFRQMREARERLPEPQYLSTA